MIRALVWKVAPDDALAGKGNRDVVAGLDEPVLFVVGANDDVAPPRLSRALFDATPLPPDRKQLLIVPGMGYGCHGVAGIPCCICGARCRSGVRA